MGKPDWSEAPDWARVLVVQNGFCGPLYCWTSAYEANAKAQWHEDIGRDHMIFSFSPQSWRIVGYRPSAEIGKSMTGEE
jgi:hypothetical protein